MYLQHSLEGRTNFSHPLTPEFYGLEPSLSNALVSGTTQDVLCDNVCFEYTTSSLNKSIQHA